MKNILTSKLKENERADAFFKDCITSIILTFAFLILLLFKGDSSPQLLVLCITALIVEILLALFVKEDRMLPVVTVYYIGGFALVAFLSFYSAQILLEGLFLIPIGITAFMYLKSTRLSALVFVVFNLLAILFQVYEFLYPPEKIEDELYILYNKLIILSLVVFTGYRGYQLLRLNISALNKLTEANQQLIKSQKRYENLFENSFDAILIYNKKQERYLNCNTKAIEVFRTTKEKLLSCSRFNITPSHQEDGRSTTAHMKEHMKKLNEAPGPLRFHFLHQRADLEIFHTETTIIPNREKQEEYIIIIKDTSEQQKINEALQESEERFRNMVEASPSGLSLNSLSGERLFVSRRAVEILGYENAEAMLGKNMYENVHPDEIQKAIKKIKNPLPNKDHIENAQYRCLKEDGTPIYIESSSKILYDEEEKPKELMILFNDITAKVEAQTELEERKVIYQTLIENAFDGIDIVDIKKFDPETKEFESELIMRNNCMKGFLEEREGNFLNSKELLSISPELLSNGRNTKEYYKECTKKIINDGYVKHFWQLVRLNGELIDLEIVTQFVPIGNKNILIRICKDITEQNRAQRQLKKSQQRYQNLLDTSPDGIVVMDMKGIINYASPRIKIRYGFTKEDEFIGRKALNFVVPEEREQTQNIIGTILDKGELRNILNKVIHKDGSNFYLETNLKLLFNESGQPSEMLMVQRDVTDRIEQGKIIQQQLKDLNHKNEELQKYIDSNMELENFAYIASHDLQAPIRNIISFTQLLERNLAEKLEAREREYLDFVVSASKNMKRLIDDLLTYSRVNTNQCNFDEVNINSLLRIIQLELKSTIEEKDAVICIDENIPTQIIGDKTKLRQLFQNMITNGLKFIHKDTKPEIKITCEDKQTHWSFSVKDNGIGIKEEFRDKIFLIFQRLHSTKEYEGTGIGLALCKKIVEQHHGEIGFSSEFGKGSTFYFTIQKNLQIPTTQLVVDYQQ